MRKVAQRWALEKGVARYGSIAEQGSLCDELETIVEVSAQERDRVAAESLQTVVSF